MCRFHFVALSLVPLALLTSGIVGCGDKNTSEEGTIEKQSEIANKIRALIPEAASSPLKEVEVLSISSPLDEGGLDPQIDNYSLTMILMFYMPPELSADETTLETRQRDIRLLNDDANVPNIPELIASLSKSKSKGYVTLIQPEYITDLTCQVKGDAATGVVSFEAKDLYQGRVEYTARRSGKAWRVTEFRLPGHKIRLSRSADGKWKKSSIEN